MKKLSHLHKLTISVFSAFVLVLLGVCAIYVLVDNADKIDAFFYKVISKTLK